MKKISVKAFSVFIVVVITMILIAGCKNNIQTNSSSQTISGTSSSAKTESNTVSNNKSAYDTSGVIKDLKGITITYGSESWQAPDSTTTGGQRLIAYYKQIEKNFNCKIVHSTVFSKEQLDASILAGKPAADLVPIPNESHLVNYVKRKMIQPLEPLKVIDFNDRTRYMPYTELSYFNKNHYGIAPNWQNSWYTFNVQDVLYFNKKVLADKGITANYLFELQDSGQWTWDKFEEIATKVVDPVNGIYGIEDGNLRFYNDLLASNNTDWINFDKNTNSFSFAGDKAESKQVLDFYLGLAKKGILKISSATNKSPQKWAKIRENKVAFICDIAAGLQWCGLDVNNIGILPSPKGPNAKDYVSRLASVGFWGVAAGCKYPAEAATIMAEMCKPYMTDISYKQEGLKSISAYYSDANSQKNLMKTAERSSHSYVSFFTESPAATTSDTGEGTGWYNFIMNLANNKSTDYSGIINANKDKYNTLLNDYYKMD
jgi:hypothetical protein